jgi:serine O-acetyltransferase
LGVVIHDRAEIKDDFHSYQNDTIRGMSKKYEIPKVENYVYIGAGAKVTEIIKIGDNIVICANADVVKDNQDIYFVGRVLAKIIEREIMKSGYIKIIILL